MDSPKSNSMLSRRNVLGLLSALSVLAPSGDERESPDGDARLVALGCEFDTVSSQIDHAIESGVDIRYTTLEQFHRVEAKIVAAQANTLEGLRVKARAACWALLGDLDSGDRSTTDKRMALSIVRDLMRLYDRT